MKRLQPADVQINDPADTTMKILIFIKSMFRYLEATVLKK